MHQVGDGVLGPVFRTYDPANDRLIAVKVIHQDITPEQAETLVAALQRLVNAGLSHPAIVDPISIGIEEGAVYLAQEFLTAGSLDVSMRKYAPATIETALPFVQHLAGAIDVAHERGIVHGGLHLRDIFVTPQDAFITGFGIIAALETTGLKGPIRRPYTAPEIVAGRTWGAEADRFSLAAITYELLTGKRAAGTGEQLNKRMSAIENVSDPEELKTVFATGLADNPEIRYSSAAAFSSALLAAAGNSRNTVDSYASDLLAGLDSSPAIVLPGAWDERLIVDDAGESNDRRNDDGQGEAEIADASSVLPKQGEETTPLLSVGKEASIVATAEAEKSVDNQSTSRSPDSGMQRGQRVTEVNPVLSSGPSDVAREYDEDQQASMEVNPTVIITEGSGSLRISETDPVVERIDHDRDDAEFTLSSLLEDREEEVSVGGVANVSRTNETRHGLRTVGLSLVALIGVALIGSYFFSFWLGSSDEVTDPMVGSGDSSTSSGVEAVGAAIGEAELSTSRSVIAEPVVPIESDAFPSNSQSEQSTPVDLSERVARDGLAVTVPQDAEDQEMGFGWLLVRTTPPGATVEVDGISRGRTPLSLDDVTFGLHQVKVIHAGYGSETREISLSQAARIVSVGVELVEGSVIQGGTTGVGLLEIDSRPDGARVVVDGYLVGTTPLVVSDVTNGIHRVRIERDGYQPWVTTVDVQPADRFRVAASLDRIPKP